MNLDKMNPLDLTTEDDVARQRSVMAEVNKAAFEMLTRQDTQQLRTQADAFAGGVQLGVAGAAIGALVTLAAIWMPHVLLGRLLTTGILVFLLGVGATVTCGIFKRRCYVRWCIAACPEHYVDSYDSSTNCKTCGWGAVNGYGNISYFR